MEQSKKEVTEVKDKHFWCAEDSKYWHTDDYCVPSEIEDTEVPDEDNQYNYYSRCPVCKKWTRAVPHYYANITKMTSTGPRTEQGKKRSSLNGIKHGNYAQAHNLLAPANGKYDICGECIDKEACENKQLKYCPYKLDLMGKFIAAYENGDIGELKAYAGLTQAKLYVILEGMMQETMKTGVLLKAPKVYNGKAVQLGIGKPDENGDYEEYETIYEYSQNPLIDSMPKVMGALGMTSDQQAMNPGKRMDEEIEMKGKLNVQDPINFMSQMTELVKAIHNGAPQIASVTRSADPVHKQAVENEENDDEEKQEVAQVSNPFN